MDDDEKHSDRREPANDDRAPDERQTGGGKAETSEQLDALVLAIARLIGRQMARADFAALVAANDSRADNASSAEDDEG